MHNIYGEYRASHPVNKLVLKENLWKKRNKNREADITNGEQYLYEERPCPMYLIPKKAMTVGIMVMMK